jgi:hypothetical protein
MTIAIVLVLLVLGSLIFDLPLPKSLVFHTHRFQLEGHGRND